MIVKSMHADLFVPLNMTTQIFNYYNSEFIADKGLSILGCWHEQKFKNVKFCVTLYY